jgi:NAD(P)-dependent dehydrogenase (short-subunit alcohol dehydrogenase family)
MTATAHGQSTGKGPSITKRFAGKVAVITGASRGIGKAVALALAREAASLVLAGRDAGSLKTTFDAVTALGVSAATVTCDVRKRRDVERLAEFAYKKMGSVHCLVNNAGQYPVTSLFEMTEEEWDEVVDTNLKGPFLCAQAFSRRMVIQKVAGKIVNISSTSSQIARPGCAHYCASKAGLNQLTRVLAVELAPHGITVNAVCPGLIGTERVFALAQDPKNVAEHETKLGRIPLARLGTPEEIAAAVLFLLSEEASYFTGSLLFADGGYACGIASYSTSPKGKRV